MNLYVITQLDVVVGSDEAAGFVVVAHDEDQARALASGGCGDEGAGIWRSQNCSECHLIGEAREEQGPRILMRDFNAG